MSLYKYQARNNKGGLSVGKVEAKSQAEATEVLEAHGLSPVRFDLVEGEGAIDQFLARFQRVSPKDKVIFFRQLSTLVSAQVRIVTTLRILIRQVASQKFRNIIEEVALDIEGGKSLSESMAVYPELFPDLYISLVRAGEASGSLDKTLNYLADQIEKDYDMRNKIRTALAYPIFIIALLFVVGGLMFTLVLPQMTAVLSEAGAELPWATKIIIAATVFFTGYWWFILIIIIGLFFSARYYLQTTPGRYAFDRLVVHLPIVGNFLEKIYLFRFSHHISNLLDGGISIVKALQLISGITGNWVYRDIFVDAAKEVQTGKALSKILENYELMPPLVYQMVAVGEQTGDLPAIMRKLAEFYSKEVDAVISTLTTLIEPVIMVVLGLAVGIMVAGILLPIYNLASAF
jgi:type IV pilus assembly protein PilC